MKCSRRDGMAISSLLRDADLTTWVVHRCSRFRTHRLPQHHNLRGRLPRPPAKRSSFAGVSELGCDNFARGAKEDQRLRLRQRRRGRGILRIRGMDPDVDRRGRPHRRPGDVHRKRWKNRHVQTRRRGRVLAGHGGEPHGGVGAQGPHAGVQPRQGPSGRGVASHARSDRGHVREISLDVALRSVGDHDGSDRAGVREASGEAVSGGVRRGVLGKRGRRGGREGGSRKGDHGGGRAGDGRDGRTGCGGRCAVGRAGRDPRGGRRRTRGRGGAGGIQ
ncbi:hypothetical protein ACHAWF_013096 [Thalassiosira exigua]